MNRTWTAALLLALAALPAAAVNVELLSRVPPRRASETVNGPSRPLAISADGRYTVTVSEAVNLVPGVDAEPVGAYLYLHDRVSGEAVRIGRRAVQPSNIEGYGRGATISADGRFVAFESSATDEVEGQEEANPFNDIFLWDRVTGESELVSRSDGDPTRTGDGGSFAPIVSANGRFVLFRSSAADLVDGIQLASPRLRRSHLFLWERQTGDILPVTRSAKTPGQYANFGADSASISADGRFIAFTSLALDLVASQIDPGQDLDAFLWDRVTQRTVLVSRAADNVNAAGNLPTLGALVSADGRFVALSSLATNLRHGQRGGGENVFLWERATGSMTLVSHGRNPESPALPGQTSLAAVSANGSHVLFSSNARNLVPSEEQPWINVFLWSRASGRNTLLSRSAAGGRGGNSSSFATGLSADGAWAVFEAPPPTSSPGSPTAMAASPTSSSPTAAPDGSSSSPLPARSLDRPRTDVSSGSQISADGRWTVFESTAADLEAGVPGCEPPPGRGPRRPPGRPDDPHGPPTGARLRHPPGRSRVQSIDASGRFVVFMSAGDASQLVPGVREANGLGADVFLYDRQLRKVTLITRSAAAPRATGDATAVAARISADGRWVSFASHASDLVPGQSGPPEVPDVFLWDRTTGRTVLASRSAGSPTAGGDGPSIVSEISADGSAVVFSSHASNLVPGQTGVGGLFLFDRTTGTVSLVSRAAGSETAVASAILQDVSANGRFVSFISPDTNLVAGATDPNDDADVFLFDRATGTTTLVSRTTSPALTAGGGSERDLSGNGRFVLSRAGRPTSCPARSTSPTHRTSSCSTGSPGRQPWSATRPDRS